MPPVKKASPFETEKAAESETLSFETDNDLLQHFFGPEGSLARSMAGGGRQWEQRPEQLAMAEAVLAAIGNQEHLLVEAGTGVGKSYAYAVPLIVWALAQRKRILIATHTKALQQQLVERDLPFLRDVLQRRMGLTFRFALCLGTGNYVCPRRLAKAETTGLFATREEVSQLKELQSFASRTKTGRILDLDFEPHPGVWSQVNRESDLCLGRACKLYEKSFFYQARREQEQAHVLVANHHLLFAHLVSAGGQAGGVLPTFDALVIDEAHQSEEVASSYLGAEVSNLGIARLIEILHRRSNNHTVLNGSALPDLDELNPRLMAAANEMREATGRFFENVQEVLNLDPTRPQSLRVRRPDFIENALDEPLGRLEGVLRDARKSAERANDEATMRELDGYTVRVVDTRMALMTLLSQSQEGYVYWVEAQPRPTDSGPAGRRTTRVPRLALRGAPIDVAEAMQETLFSKICPVILTSATLSSAEGAGESGFDFLRERLGLTPEQCKTPVRTLSLGSPFNYRQNAMLYLTRDLPDPADPQRFEAAASVRAAEVLKLTEGRAFVLCTSFRLVEGMAKHLRQTLPRSINVLKQGEHSRGKLLSEFRSDVSSVLVGTTSFWQGVDVPGEALSCVIIVKLPFAVPDDPLVQARVESLRARGRDAFNEYQVPQAVMMFRQGFGRLIRTATDRGIVAILDPRVLTKRYGRAFLDSLPECGVTDELDEVARFAATMDNSGNSDFTSAVPDDTAAC